jgi:mannose-6-phosphate isomerase
MIDHPHHQSEVTNGEWAGKTLRDICSVSSDWLLGNASQEFSALPLLLKYLDCQRVLSVQVHPEDAYALQMSPPDLGKTEAWYIISAEPGAKLYAGLKAGVTSNDLASAVKSGTVEECLHVIEPDAGDCMFIPAGTVHALGAGLLVAEIQQASNTTFRLFDWNRVGADGNPRELHIERGLEVIDFDSGPRQLQVPQATDQDGREQLVSCEKFVLDRLLDTFDGQMGGDGKFHLVTVPRGAVELSWDSGGERRSENLTAGHSVFVPACMPGVQVTIKSSESTLLDMYLP